MAKAKSTSTKTTGKSTTTKKATSAKAKTAPKSKATTGAAAKKTAATPKPKTPTKAKSTTKTKTAAKPRAKAKTKENDFFSLLTDFDIHLFKSGKHHNLYEKLGAHEVTVKNKKGTFFAVWAPNAKSVSVIGNFNSWDKQATSLFPRWDGSGIWESFIPGIGHGEVYKYAIETQSGHWLEKGDPFGTYWEEPPKTASVIWNSDYKWKDKKWMDARKKKAGKPQPYAVYEVHFGSWKQKIEEENRSLTYKEMGQELAAYAKDMGYTHVEFLPLMEHPFYGSWGYQLTGYYATTSRYGSPQDFKEMIDAFHAAGIGVILDWVPSHFPGDAHGLYEFDGTHLYEHADPRKGFHPDWKSYIFNYGRNEVRAFLISNALYWLKEFHIDGLRVDAVASMLYLDYSREDGEWIPNEYGGNENLEAISLLKEMNEAAYGAMSDIITIAEESTSWPMVSKPTYLGGLGFGQKWMMGWMHDTLEYFKKDPIHRQYHQNEITFSVMYAFTENFMLPLSHDEVVHGKGPLIARMPGDEWQRFANLRLMYGLMYAHPGTKLLFMGGEFGQTREWKHEMSLDWHLLEYDVHKGVQNWVRDLNNFYTNSTALYEQGFLQEGFEWIDYSDHKNSVITFLRKGVKENDLLLVVCNFTPQMLNNYLIGVPLAGQWKEEMNSDAKEYHGSGVLNTGLINSNPAEMHGRKDAINLQLPPLGITILSYQGDNLTGNMGS